MATINELLAANGGERVAINLAMATSREVCDWLLAARPDPAHALATMPDSVRDQLLAGAAAGAAKRAQWDHRMAAAGQVEAAVGAWRTGGAAAPERPLHDLHGPGGGQHAASSLQGRASLGQPAAEDAGEPSWEAAGGLRGAAPLRAADGQSPRRAGAKQLPLADRRPPRATQNGADAKPRSTLLPVGPAARAPLKGLQGRRVSNFGVMRG